ncbi:hypothetical protein E4L96_04310 [Massilia arenosa]|uniref:Porin domain-containing protein n=2 Tax=Zemynaea arenosa TaxID=2561931 RepID=A0A4Y9SJL8_9BURK|nr:hypothetical protein E4L96_04310 [Massilia arenosa]
MQHTDSPSRMSRFRIPFALSALALAAATCAAQEAPAESAASFTVSGFGTLSMVHKADRQSDFVSSVLNANGAGATRVNSINPDSRLGVQFTATSGQWTAVLQLISEQQITNTWRPIVEWGNIKYQATPDLALRLGRIALPMGLAADYRKVGYAFPWVRTPVEVYGAIPITNSDGLDLSYRWNRGDVKNVTQVFYGRNNQKVGENSRLQARHLAGLSNTVTWGAATARVSYLTTELTVDLAHEGFVTYRMFGPAGAAIADQWDADHKRADSLSLGLAYDPGTWFAQGEIGRASTRSYLGDRHVVYLTGGARLGEFTPYLAFAASHPRGATATAGVPLTTLPPAVRPTAAYLTGELNTILRHIADQHTLSAGVRWDLRDNLDLKFQVDRIQPRGQSYGTFVNTQPGFVPGHAVTVATAALDFVF